MFQKSEKHEAEDVELLERSDGHYVKDEQQQHLLGDASELEYSLAQAQRKRKQKQWLALSSFIAIIFFGLLIVSFRGEASQAQREVEDALGIQNNDYILSQDWDYNAPPQTREFHWIVREHEHNPDGIFRPMLLVNNQYPGPMIRANDGDTVVVRVENAASNSTSIHWHGMFQNGSSYMDGSVGINSCPIAPGNSFTYQFKIAGQHGTSFWHGHFGVQSADGLVGPIVIHSRREKNLQPAYDTDRVILISDHYHDLSGTLMFQYLMPDAENAEPVPESALLNGHNMRDCDLYPARKCDNATITQPDFLLDPNQAHRLRLVNTGAFAEFQFQIDEHEMDVTEVDGVDVHPQSYHRININPAQRYSVILQPHDTGSYWMRARMVTHCFTDPPSTMEPDVLATVRFSSSTDKPASKDWSERLDVVCKDLNTTELKPVEVITPPEPDFVFYLRSNFEIGSFRLSRGFFNTSSWRPNIRSPTLFRAAQGLSTMNQSFDAQNAPSVNSKAFDVERELVIQTQGIQTIDLLISNFDDGVHPFHLHGHTFFVLAHGKGAPPLTRSDAAIDRQSLQPLYESLNTTNPLRRDTASIEAFGWLLIRIVADNPGSWPFHCHNSWHAEAGLVMQLLARSDDLAMVSIPQSSLDLCKAEGLERGMGPDDAVYEEFA